MDLGSLELQIFVSLTVVLGGAFAALALVCDYLKRNNDQLREQNIELRVQKEEQERRLLLDPVGLPGQWLPGNGNNAANRAATPTASHGNARPVAAHEVMQSFAAPEALREAETRASRFQARCGEEAYDSADVPPLTQRRSGRIRAAREGTRDGRANGESYSGWVRPEVIARVARKSEATAAYDSDIRDDLDSTQEVVRPELVNAAHNWDVRDQLTVRKRQAKPVAESVASSASPAPIGPSAESSVVAEPGKEPVAELRQSTNESTRLQRETERVSQMERQTVGPAPGTILRPLTVPSLSLREEIQRVSKIPAATVAIPAVWHNPLLQEVIAASGARAGTTENMETPSLVALVEPEIEAEPLPLVPLAIQETAIEVAEPTPVVLVLNESAPLPIAVAPLPFITGDEAAVLVDDMVFQNDTPEAIEPPPFTFLTVEESAPIPVEKRVDDRIEAVDPLPPTVDANDKAAPIAVERRIFQSDPVNAVDPQPLAFLTGEDPAPITIAARALQSGAIEAMAPAAFPFVGVEETAPIVAETPVVVEQPDLQSKAIAAAEPPAITFVTDEEFSPIVVELAVAALPVFVEEPGCQRITAEGESASIVAQVQRFLSAAAETIPSPPLVFFPVEETLINRAEKVSLSEAAILPALPRNTVVEAAQSFEEAPAVIEASDLSAEGAEAAVLREVPADRAEAEATVGLPPFEESVSRVEGVEDAVEPSPVLASKLPAAELTANHLDEQPFTLIMSVEAETAGTVRAESKLPNIRLEAPSAISETKVADQIPMANFDDYTLGPRLSTLSGMAVTPIVHYLPTLPAIGNTARPPSLYGEPALAPSLSSMDIEPDSLPGLHSLYSGLNLEPASAALLDAESAEPPPFCDDVGPVSPEPVVAIALSAPIDISVARPQEVVHTAEMPVATLPDLLLPTGMHDIPTWTRLLSLPNPMTGILFVITLQPSDPAPVLQRAGATPPADDGPAIEKLMASFVREGDFGTRIADDEWIFIYNHDVAGFNQRRVGMIAEKLWDFQLRHLGTANVRFNWGAVDVKSEALGEAVQAARDLMNQTRGAGKLPGADQSSTPRRAVNA